MDHQRINEAVARLSAVATEDVPARTTLAELCDLAADVLDVDGVGVMLTDSDRNRYVHATTSSAAVMERTQESLRSGPCRDAARTGETVTVVGLDQIDRWPGFSATAAEVGLGAIAALPLMSRGRCWGVLDLYRSRAVPWDGAELQAARLLADVATSHVVTASDRDAARLAQAQLAHVSSHDDLTGLPNRSLLIERLSWALESARSKGEAVGVIFADLDHFKFVNDTHGHRAGDLVLGETARRLNGAARTADTVGRLAGDEFVLVCGELETTDRGGPGRVLEAVAAKVRESMATPIVLPGGPVRLDVSLGAAISTGGTTAEDLLHEADTAMYLAKHASDRTLLPIRDLDSRSTGPRTAPRDGPLDGALDRNEFEMHYQPVVRSTRPDEIHGVEALVRWRGQDGEVLPAQAFVESAVRRGVLPTSGAWGIDQVCAQVARWNADHGEHAPRVAYVNLGAHEVNDPSLPSMLDSACSRHGVQPHQIGLEIVEHDFVHPGLIDRLTVLRTRGHPLAVDDFGTGYSSISRLFDLQVDVAKIDRRFVQGLPDDARRAGFVQAVIAIAASLGLEVVAEGVETPAQQRFLTDIGCTYLQGYLLGPPQAAADLAPRFRA